MANVFDPEFDGDQARPGFTYRRAKLGWQAGAQRLGASLYEIPNRADRSVRVLVVSTMIAPEVNLYPDSGKLMAATRPPGGKGEGFQEAYRRHDATDYWESETPPGAGE